MLRRNIFRPFRLTITLLPVLLLAVLCVRSDANAPQTKQDTQSPKAKAIGRRLDQKGVPNFGEVTPNLYRGGLLNSEGLTALKKLGVEVVVDTRADSEQEREEAEGRGMKYVAIPWHCPWPHDEIFARFLSVMHDNRGKKVFVHCRLGDDRTGMMVAAYRMAEEDWTAQEAMNEMRSFGFSTAHHFICPSLAGYEKHFPEHLKENTAFAEERARHGK